MTSDSARSGFHFDRLANNRMQSKQYYNYVFADHLAFITARDGMLAIEFIGISRLERY